MVKYIDWGKHIRLGNWLFLYAGLQSILKDVGNPLAVPPYFLWKYLQNPPFITDNDSYGEVFHIRQTHYSPEEKQYMKQFFRDKANSAAVNINLGGHLQSEKWFIEDIDYIKEKLALKPEEISKVREKYAPFFMRKTIGVGIRRGDFVNHGCFYQIPEDWYRRAIEAEFQDWREYNIIVFSDDIDWCKKYYAGTGMLFAESNNTHTHADNFKHYHNDPMEQFILGTQMDNFVGGSSTFTWWQMWYVKNFNNGKVVHSGKNLIGKCAQDHFNPDYYPDNWTLHNI
jgi:hypothetical protein